MKNITDPKSNTVVDRYLYPDLEKEFGIAVNALKARMRAANITPQREGRVPYVTKEQADILRQQHQYLQTPGTTLKSYQDAYGVTNIVVSDTSESEDREVVFSNYDEFMRNARDEILMNQRLKAYAAFETYHLLGKTISDHECQELIGWKPPRSGFREESYRFIRVGKTNIFNPETGKLESENLWKIEKVNLELELQLKQGRRKQRSLSSQKEEEEKAIAIYDQVKEALSP